MEIHNKTELSTMPNVTIAFDAKRLTHNATGLGNYSRFVLNALASTFPQNAYHLFSPSLGQTNLYRDLVAHPSVRMSLPSSAYLHLPLSWWRTRGVASQVASIGADIFHGLSNEIPFGIKRPTATVLTVHDLIYLRYPNYYKPIDRILYRMKYASSARRADLILAISQTTKQDLVDFFQIKPERIAVVYQGCSEAFALATDQDAEQARLKYTLPKDYILYVGSIEPRKNLDLLVRALSQVRQKSCDVHLVAVGRETKPYTQHIRDLIHKHQLSDHVHLLHQVPFSDLPGLYHGANLFCYPSKFEGFGIPIIEALSAGIPIIGATSSCLEEAGGNAQLYTHPDDPYMLATMMERVLSNTQLRQEMIEQGQKHITQFQPQSIAREIMRNYQTLL